MEQISSTVARSKKSVPRVTFVNWSPLTLQMELLADFMERVVFLSSSTKTDM